CGKNAEGLVLTSFFFFDPKKPELIAWKDEFVSKAGFEPTAYPGNAYDCVLMLAEAIKNIGDDKVTRQTIRDSLARTEIVGISGPIHFDETGGVVRKYLIFQIEDGKYVLRKGYDYANE
ncbi:MAG: ABC transporter substrate-binding protein, partial [Fretibacterium sp.]